MILPKRKPTRLKGYDYSAAGAYFITICVKNRKELLSKIIVGDDAYIVPKNQISNYGSICDKYINNINNKYENVTVDKYVIMPNHIHLIIFLHGTMRASSPTKNIKDIIRSFKTMVTKEIGNSIWQRSYHDHIIRDKNDYQKIWEYIDTNVQRWDKDCFYTCKTEQ
ncbi:MAG: transposase [Clostridia bacterium]|nr:transposase [Clostridia bacterium]